jgi:hypothetical protein
MKIFFIKTIIALCIITVHSSVNSQIRQGQFPIGHIQYDCLPVFQETIEFNTPSDSLKKKKGKSKESKIKRRKRKRERRISRRRKNEWDRGKIKKPVIYLYPTKDMDVEVKLDIKGETIFTYPAYDSSWTFTAEPDGTLHFGESTYNYLFWEAIPDVQPLVPKDQTGFVVQGTETIAFLEEKLTLAGLTSKEQADFITFWGPQLSKNETNFVRFEFNESCDRYAELSITPKPDNIYRIYMIWNPVHSGFKVKDQEIIPINREGFTVVEWGGQELRHYNP